MRQSFLPNTDDSLRGWALNLAGILDTQYASYGLSQQMAENFRALADAYATSYREATNPQTRTRGMVMRKNDCREALKIAARSIVAIIRGQPDVTDPQKVNLGLTIPAARRTSIAPPDHAPFIKVLSVSGHTVRIRLCDATVARRGRPMNVKAALVMTHVGDQPPMIRDEWKLAATTSKTSLDLIFDASVVPGAVVWLTAQWLSPTSKPGPASDPISTRVQGGGAEGLGAMGIAA